MQRGSGQETIRHREPGRTGTRQPERPRREVGQILRSLLHNVKLLDGCLEVAQRLLRQGVRDAQLEYGSVRKGLHHMLIDGAGAYDADFEPLRSMRLNSQDSTHSDS